MPYFLLHDAVSFATLEHDGLFKYVLTTIFFSAIVMLSALSGTGYVAYGQWV
jgi:hypothetical protein